MTEILWMAGNAFLVALVLTPILRDVFRSYNLVDRPGRRKVHAYPIPRLGGIAIAAAFVFALIRFTQTQDLPGIYAWPAWEILPGAAVLFFTGVLDDLFTLRPLVKLSGQFAAAGLAYWGGLRIESIGHVALPLWFSVLLTISWLLVSTNALNLIDGLDGLCTSMGFVAAATFFVVADVRTDVPLQHAALLLAGALLGFLCHNFNPATMFLGDSGALSIGFVLGCFGVIWTRNSEALPGVAVPLMALSVPLIDSGLAVVRRFLSGRGIFEADRGHVHHRLLDRGLTARQVTLILSVWALVAAGFAVLVTLPALSSWRVSIILGFCAAAWVGVQQLRYAEFSVAARLMFQGEFRQTVQAKSRLRNLTSALSRSTGENEWWEVLCAAARDSSWGRMRWIQREQVLREWSLDSRATEWTYRIALADGAALEIEGSLAPAEAPLDLHAFGQAVRSSFAAQVEARTAQALKQ